MAVFGLKKFLGKTRHHIGVVKLARENIQIDIIALVGKMPGDEGSFNQLGHRKPGDSFVFAKVHDHGLAKTFHFNKLA